MPRKTQQEITKTVWCYGLNGWEKISDPLPKGWEDKMLPSAAFRKAGYEFAYDAFIASVRSRQGKSPLFAIEIHLDKAASVVYAEDYPSLIELLNKLSSIGSLQFAHQMLHDYRDINDI